MRLIQLLMAIVCMAITTGIASAKSQQRPNIVIFLTDDHSQADLSPYGGTEFRTVNMQRLADAGLTFDHAYVVSPTCAPSRAALLTGLMPSRNGAEPNHAKPHADLKKWPAYFKELGYEVVAFGKVAHYKHTSDYGFDHFAHDTFHDHAGIPAAVEFMKKRSSEKPLCIFVGSNWPHVPWPEVTWDGPLTLPDTSIDTPETRRWRGYYAAAVKKADEDLGVIYDTARSTLGNNTLFLLTSDHGTQWPFGKWNLYEAGIRVPMIAAWPGVIKPGTRTDAIVNWVDLLPTALEAAGGKAPKNLDGSSFVPVLRGKKKQHRDELFATHTGDGRWNIYPMRSVRVGNWKYIRNLHPEFAFTTHIDLPGNLGQRAYFSTWENAAKTNSRAAAIVKRYHQRPPEELYNLADDPDEQRNLAANPAHAKRLATMRKKLDGWMRDLKDEGKVHGTPRLLTDKTSWGPEAVSPEAPRNPPPKKAN